MKQKKLFLCLLALLVSIVAKAQYYTEWSVLEGGYYELIIRKGKYAEEEERYVFQVNETEKTAKVIRMETENYDITIPKYIMPGDGITYHVNEISKFFFKWSYINPHFIDISDVAIIGDSAFYCSNLKAVYGNGVVRSIGAGAFAGCRELWGQGIIKEGVTSIGEGAFYGCSKLPSVTIPGSVTSIGNFAFYNCTSLISSVTIPSSVTSIGVGGFCGCSSLPSVTIPSSVTSIGVGAFWGCSSLTSVTIPGSVTSIGNATFWGCI